MPAYLSLSHISYIDLYSSRPHAHQLHVTRLFVVSCLISNIPVPIPITTSACSGAFFFLKKVNTLCAVGSEQGCILYLILAWWTVKSPRQHGSPWRWHKKVLLCDLNYYMSQDAVKQSRLAVDQRYSFSDWFYLTSLDTHCLWPDRWSQYKCVCETSQNMCVCVWLVGVLQVDDYASLMWVTSDSPPPHHIRLSYTVSDCSCESLPYTSHVCWVSQSWKLENVVSASNTGLVQPCGAQRQLLIRHGSRWGLWN